MNVLSPSFERSTGHGQISKETIVRKFGPDIRLEIRTPRTGIALDAIQQVENALDGGDISDAKEAISKTIERAERIGASLHIGLHYKAS